jgi:hypothetical protein
MFNLALLAAILLPNGALAGGGRCDGLKAEVADISAHVPVACEEARDVHTVYLKAFPEVLEMCRKIEAEVAAGAPKLALNTESEMQFQVMEAKQRHLTERRDLADHVMRDLLPTPLDSLDPTRLPIQVGAECSTEIENHIRFRRQVLDSIQELYVKLDKVDDALFAQASERALPANVEPRTPASAPVPTPRKVR